MEKKPFWEDRVPKSNEVRQTATPTDKAFERFLKQLPKNALQILKEQIQKDIQNLENNYLTPDEELKVLTENQFLIRLPENANDNLVKWYKELRENANQKEIVSRKLYANEYRKMLGQNPNFTYFADYVINVLPKKNDDPRMLYKSIALLREALKQYPNVIEFHEELAKKFCKLGKYDNAAQVYEHLIDLFENKSEIQIISKKLEPHPLVSETDEYYYRSSYEEALFKQACYLYQSGDFKGALRNTKKLENQKDDPEIGFETMSTSMFEPIKIKSLFQIENYNEILGIIQKKIEDTFYEQTEDHDDFIFGSKKDEEDFWHSDLIEHNKARINLLTDELYFKILLNNEFEANTVFFKSILSDLRLLEQSSKVRFKTNQEINNIKLKLAFCALKTGNFVNAFELYTEIDPKKRIYPDFMSTSSSKNNNDKNDEKSISIALLIASDNGFDLSQALELGKACSYLELGDLTKGFSTINQVLEYLIQNPKKIFNQNLSKSDDRNFKHIVLFNQLKDQFVSLQKLLLQKLTNPNDQNTLVFSKKLEYFVNWIEINYLDFTKTEYSDL